jgi:hypothetical protein
LVLKGILKALIISTLGSTREILRIEHESISTKFLGGWSEPFTNYHTGDLNESSSHESLSMDIRDQWNQTDFQKMGK